jgi:transcriptional regulator with XRE-family HTH domain
MKLLGTAVKNLCDKRGIGLNELLRGAGVSRTAYYSLARKDSVLPKSIRAIARQLNVRPSEFLEEESRAEQRALAVMANVQAVMQDHPDLNPDNIRHTLLLLHEKPVDRLRRALLRAQAVHLYRK